ncbi:hypothetical protein AYO20_04533 [Fonsecaea nubica]|uniref:BTB domain-containing protein n=1 Tax=Fonsecaea nubica TaxID=856822 RepID=A0A178D200_9EURO|nr:hypothetical protein AYO20_04533 [Fonsecaea nubica]OAL36119.1 hypothetical protein AYO20_04533 [Fonsecaea nubica]
MSTTQNMDLKVVDKWGDLILEVGASLRDDLSSEGDGEQFSEVDFEQQSDSDSDSEQSLERSLRQDRIPSPDSSVAIKDIPLRILVSSKVLTMGSLVFKEMLHGSFAEAQLHFSQVDPPTLSLPEDNPRTTLLFCEIVHCSPGIHHFKGYKTLHELGIFADKYDCTRSLRSWFRGQLFRFVGAGHDYFDIDALLNESMSAQQMLKLCFLMNDAEMFALASKTVYNHISPSEIRPKLETVYEDEVPGRLVDLLCSFGRHYIHDFAGIGPALIAHVSRQRKWYGYFTPIPCETAQEEDELDHSQVTGLCYGNTVRIGVLGATLASLSLLPSNDPEVDSKRSPVAMLRKLQRLGEVDFGDRKMCCPKTARCSCGHDLDIKFELDKKIKAAKQKARGICLGCVKDDTEPISDFLHSHNSGCQRHVSWGE